jgi:UDP-N-acetylmuramate dehydrogenase
MEKRCWERRVPKSILEPEVGSAEAAPEARLADYTTLRVGGPARRLMAVASETELVDCVRDLDAHDEPVLILGGGSNLLVADSGFDGTVVKIETQGIGIETSGCSGAIVTVAAGEDWDALVLQTIEKEYAGLEAMSGIPGLVGATPMQNVGAYGAEVADSIETVRTYDRQTRQLRTFPATDCGFTYRSSRFKIELGRYLILSVTFQLRLGSRSAPIRYPELARILGVEVGRRVPASAVREAVLSLRRAKGMVLDDQDHDTWSAGSFFTNPILDGDQIASLPADAPRFPQPDGRVKTSAAWLIERAGFRKGYGEGAARVSTKHTLALTNRGSASAADLITLAREIRAGVQAAFGLTLVPEPVLVGCTL